MEYSQLPETLARIDHRMQFILGPEFVEDFESWHRTVVAGGLRLSSHPDLTVTSVGAGSVTLTLLGYILDPEAPGVTDTEILTSIAADVADGTDLFLALEPYGGRYLLIADDGALRVVGDPVGTMQLVHTVVDGRLWCAAQPHVLQRLFGLPEDAEALAYMTWVQGELDEHLWPVDATNVEGLWRLLPNHYLDLNSHEVVRYWPRRQLVEGEVDELRPKIVARLEGLMAAAANRFPLSVGVSAGYDSRIILAASRGVAQDIAFYTGQGGGRGARHPDIAIPTAMLAELGLDHDVIVTRDAASPEFTEVYRDSISFHHEKRVPGQQTQLDHYRLSRVAVLGNTSEIARRALWNSRRAPPLVGWPTPEHLSLLAATPHPFAVRHFKRWLDGLEALNGYEVLDLFFWEHRNGMWFSHNCSQFMLGWRDVFLPFSCRALLLDMLAVPAVERADMGKTFYVSLAQQMWPEVLAYPINPVSRVAKARRQAFQTLRKFKRALFPKNRVPAAESGTMTGATSGPTTGAATGAATRAMTAVGPAASHAANPGNSPVLDGKNRLT